MDVRAFGEFGWSFANAGEKYRKLVGVSAEDKLMMCGLFKQATMGDCQPEDIRRADLERRQQLEWLKFKGMDTYDAKKLYIEKVEELIRTYSKPIEAGKQG